MRAVVQRVLESSVEVDDKVIGEIGPGLLILVGIALTDTQKDIDYILDKIVNMRIFDDDEGRMDRSLVQTGGSLLIVSQFTLYGDVRKGRRPSYIEAAKPDDASLLYDQFVLKARDLMGHVQTGKFQAAMNVHSINNGPVTIILDSNKS